MSYLAAIAHGRVRMEISGCDVEKIINAASRRGVVLRGVKRHNSKTLRCSMAYDEFFRMRAPLRDLRCHVKILSRFGFPHMRGMLRLRAIFAAGAIVCLLLLIMLTQMVWDIRVIGSDGMDEEALEQALRRVGIHVGMLRMDIDSDAVDISIRENFTDISFVTARMRGLTLEVEIIHALTPPNIFDRDTPVDIVATRDGVIERVLALEGRAMVQPGQRVRAGDVLIEGRAIGPGGEMSVHAMGEVYARVWDEGEGEAPLYEEIATATGNYKNRTLFWILGYWMPVLPDPPYENYQLASLETPILPGLFLPAGIRRETAYEMLVTRKPRDESLVMIEAELAASRNALSKLPFGAAVVDKWVEYDKINDSTLFARVGLQYIREIGVESAAQVENAIE